MVGGNATSFQELDHDGQGGAMHCLGSKANGFFGMVALRASGAKHHWRTGTVISNVKMQNKLKLMYLRWISIFSYSERKFVKHTKLSYFLPSHSSNLSLKPPESSNKI